MIRRYTIDDHIWGAFFDNQHAEHCEVCGLTTAGYRGLIHWLAWFGHDMTVGWSRAHWRTYSWGEEEG